MTHEYVFMNMVRPRADIIVYFFIDTDRAMTLHFTKPLLWYIFASCTKKSHGETM